MEPSFPMCAQPSELSAQSKENVTATRFRRFARYLVISSFGRLVIWSLD
jgi:hypothetical protein